MLTQCPHCLTLFRVKPEQLKVAAGKVRCCQCNSVFNALQRLQESPVAFTQTASEDGEDDWLAEMEEDEESSRHEADNSTRSPSPSFDFLDGRTDGFEEDTRPSTETIETALPTEDLRVEEDSTELSDFILEQDDGLAPEPDYFAAGTESQMSELLDQDTTSTLLTEEFSDDGHHEDADVLDFLPKDASPDTPEEPPTWESFGDSILKDDIFDTADERPDYDSIPAFRAIDEPSPSLPIGQLDDERVYNFQASDDDKKLRVKQLPWIIGSLLLLLVFSSQLAWQWRDTLIQHATGRQLLGGICWIAGCDLPIRRDTDKIVIQGRNLSTHPNKPEVLLMQLSMINTAAFEQPFPQLQLTLYNDKGKLIARRTFTPSDYLPSGMAENAMMPKAQPVLVEMELADPGSEVTGFTFDFL
jgi:predicted Zn finger-like uncharacterized protein